MKKLFKEHITGSIKNKLIISFMIVIFLILYVFIFFTYSQMKIISSYEEVLDNMILEREISDKISSFIDSYNDLGKNIENPEKAEVYRYMHDEIIQIFLELDDKIVNKESRIVFEGLRHIVNDIITDCDRGIADIKKGDLSTFSFYYNEAIRKSYYVEENTAMLLTKEVEFAEMTKEKIQNVKEKNIFIGVFIITFIVLVCVIFSLLFSKSITRPLETLLLNIENVKAGVYKQKQNRYSDDEIGKLGMAFDEMVKKINASQNELEKKVTELENTKLAIMNILEDTNETNSELNITKDELKRKVEQLNEINKKKDEFISVTAHELKTPLTSIKGFTELLKNEQVMKNKEMRENYFNIIIQDTVRLGNLITDILDLTRFDLGTLKFNIEDVATDEIINDVKNLVGIQVKNKGLGFRIELEKGIMLDTDRSRIVQVISNLINNSIKYTEKGEIRLQVFRKEKKVHFRVTDTGVGIPKEAQSRIFERFYQADSSYTRKVGGSGLGLSICKTIVESLGGTIWFESRKGRTMFEFTLNEKVDKK